MTMAENSKPTIKVYEVNKKQQPPVIVLQADSRDIETTGRFKRTWSPARRKAYEDKKLLKESLNKVSSDFLKGTSLTAKDKAALKAQKKEEREIKRAARQKELEIRREGIAARKAARIAKKEEAKKNKIQHAIESKNLIQWPQTLAEVEYFQTAPLNEVSLLSREEINKCLFAWMWEEATPRFYFCPVFYYRYRALAFLRKIFHRRYIKFFITCVVQRAQLKDIKNRLQIQLLKNRLPLLDRNEAKKISGFNKHSPCLYKLQRYTTRVSRDSKRFQSLLKTRAVSRPIKIKIRYTLSNYYSGHINWLLWLRHEWRHEEFDNFIVHLRSDEIQGYLQEEDAIFWMMWDIPEENIEELELGWPTLSAVLADWAVYAASEERFFSRLAGIDEISENITDFPDFEDADDDDEDYPDLTDEELSDYEVDFVALNLLLNKHASAWGALFNFTVLSVTPKLLGVKVNNAVKDDLYEMRHALNAIADDMYDETFEVALILDFFYDHDYYYFDDYDYVPRPWQFLLKQNITEFYLPHAHFLNSVSLVDPTFRFTFLLPMRSLKFLSTKLKTCVNKTSYFFYSTYDEFSEHDAAFDNEVLDWVEIVEDENDFMELRYNNLEENFVSFIYQTPFHGDTIITFNQIFVSFHLPVRRIYEDVYFLFQLFGGALEDADLREKEDFINEMGAEDEHLDLIEDYAYDTEIEEENENTNAIEDDEYEGIEFRGGFEEEIEDEDAATEEEDEDDISYGDPSMVDRNIEIALYKDLRKARRAWGRKLLSTITKAEKKFKLKFRKNCENVLPPHSGTTVALCALVDTIEIGSEFLNENE